MARMKIFLDFDGVLRRESSPKSRLDEDCVRNFEQALPRIRRQDVHSLLEGMHARHRRSIATCESLLRGSAKAP